MKNQFSFDWRKARDRRAQLYRSGFTLAAIGAIEGVSREAVRASLAKDRMNRHDGGAHIRAVVRAEHQAGVRHNYWMRSYGVAPTPETIDLVVCLRAIGAMREYSLYRHMTRVSGMSPVDVVRWSKTALPIWLQRGTARKTDA